jgi:hypothetical protein
VKADISETGMLTVSAETPLEAYALRQWIKANSTRPTDPFEPSMWQVRDLLVKGHCDEPVQVPR